MAEIYLKEANRDVKSELKLIGFDKSYISKAEKKYKGKLYKIFNLKPYEANILKQICLSLGFDCAVNRDSITCKCEKTDCMIFATESQYEKLVQKLEQQPFRLKEVSRLIKEVLKTEIKAIEIRGKIFDWKEPYVMGILNITPDSFSDGGKYIETDKAIKHFEEMIEEGADIIDIGGESTRPGAEKVEIEEEINRVIPVIKRIREINEKAILSIDTRNYETAKAAIEEGADIINDVTGLDNDERLYEYVTEMGIPTIIMHSNGIPAVKYNEYEGDIVEEIYKNLDKKIKEMIESGMERKNIIIDAGIGFGKTIEEDYEIIKRINEFKSLGSAILLGISRKSLLRKKFQEKEDNPDEITAIYSGILSDVNIHRVHNVGLTKRYIRYTKQIKSNK